MLGSIGIHYSMRVLCGAVNGCGEQTSEGERERGIENYTDAVTVVEKSLFFDEIYKILTFPTNRNESDGGGGVQYGKG